MGARAQNPPVVEAWIASLGRCSKAEQYPGPVRRFLRTHGSDDLASVTEAELIAYAVAIGSDGVRKKALSALESFFGYVTKQGHVAPDPARFLWQSVRRALEERSLIEQLAGAGLSTEAAADLSWRDVAAMTILRTPPTRGLKLTPELHRHLSGELLERLQAVSAEQLDSVLDSRVVSPGAT
jgi:hypothetical protein